MAIYGLPPIRMEETLESYGARVADVVDARSDVVAARLRAGNVKGVRGR